MDEATLQAAVRTLGDASAWTAITSGLARLDLSAAEADEAGRARAGSATAAKAGHAPADGLRMQFDFAGGGGFVVARREIRLGLPAFWNLSFLVRGQGPANTLEVKLVDEAGTSVWRAALPAFLPPGEWTRLALGAGDFGFAWGPRGGGAPAAVSAVEVALVAPPGGQGFLELAAFALECTQPATGILAQATRVVAPALRVVAGASPGDAPREPGAAQASRAGARRFEVDLGGAFDLGGVVLHWCRGRAPSSFHVDASGDGDPCVVDVATAGPGPASVKLVARGVRRLVVDASSAEGRDVELERIEVKPAAWSASEAEFLTNVAQAARRGAWPRWCVREQVRWTPVAAPDGRGALGLLTTDGAVELGHAGCLLEPSVVIGEGADARWITWADVTAAPSLVEEPLPQARVCWRAEGLRLDVEPWASGDGRVHVGIRLDCDAPDPPRRVRLLLALRPLQATPPWQAWKQVGGPSPIRSIEAAAKGAALVNGALEVRVVGSEAAFGAAAFHEGGVAAWASRGHVPPHAIIHDAEGRSEGLFAVDAVDGYLDVVVEASWRRAAEDGGAEAIPDGFAAVGDARVVNGGGRAVGNERATVEDGDSVIQGEAGLAEARAAWRKALAGSVVAAPGSAPEVTALVSGATTAIAHVLACRDGAALQPGPRRYTRSWIRDGAVMAAALAAWGRGAEARAFVEWYEQFVAPDGSVPCCVDADGVDPLVEHDSHGQFLWAVATLVRFGAVDEAWLAARSDLVDRVADYVVGLVASRRTAGWRGHAAFGLLPESVSHEGYLAHPVHAYWDDWWALRGLRDAAYLARRGAGPSGARRDADAEQLAADVAASMRRVALDRGLATLPASVEWADFDPTAVAGAVALADCADVLDAAALERTLDAWMDGLRGRRSGASRWNNYSPYEVRLVGALVRCGRREESLEALGAMLEGQRPAAWRQWPEIVWHDDDAPAHVGDLPHCWIGAESVLAVRSMLVFERETDGALVLGAGVPPRWIDEGFRVEGLATWYGMLHLAMRREADGTAVVRVEGDARPPGGFVVMLGAGEAWRLEGAAGSPR